MVPCLMICKSWLQNSRGVCHNKNFWLPGVSMDLRRSHLSQFTLKDVDKKELSLIPIMGLYNQCIAFNS